jgi:hypothetical protein
MRLTRIGLLSISFVVACGGSSGGPTRDTVAPAVTSTAPADGATGVLLQPAITATFSEDMSVDSIASDGLSLSPAVPGSVSYSGKTATFTPSAGLAYETTYKVTVKTSAKDMAGNALVADFSWSFSTIAAPPAPIAVPGDARDVNVGETVVLDGSKSQSISGKPLTYAWSQVVLGADVTGGIAKLVGEKPSFVAPAAVGTLRFDLVVSDGIKSSAPARIQLNVMEDKGKAVFVAVNGDDANAGSRAEPMKSIQAAIEKARATAADVYIAEGEYAESLTLADGVSLYGGFAAAWVRDPAVVTKVASPAPKAIGGVNVGGLVIDGLTIVSADAAKAGQSSYGILLASSSAVTISNNDISAGNGANGGDGKDGKSGAEGKAGSNGGNGCTIACAPSGGAPGGAPGFPGGLGGNGSDARAAGSPGIDGFGPAAGGHGGGGRVGAAGSNGSDGGQGTAGSTGTDGTGLGTVTLSGYLAVDGKAGTSGLDGSGGGGGGGGGSNCGGLFCLARGNGGGGGGAGGSFGQGAAGGRGGGGSFGIFLSKSPTVVAENNTFHLGKAGLGGKGGTGGKGGAGGAGGQGGANADVLAGGTGGSGGAGGAGGNGGKGADGPAKEVFSD